LRYDQQKPDFTADDKPMTEIAACWRLRAFAVHILTASGVGLALLALIAAVHGEWAQMFWLLGIALMVDGIDGAIARRLRVAEVLPNWSGDALDFVTDFTTYVFVPAYALAASGLLPPPLAVPLGLIVAVTGALYFADRRMKTTDNYFRGFPALWNAAAFYLFLLKPHPWFAACMIVSLAALQFVPLRFVHPFRVARLRLLSLVLLALWSALAALTLVRGFDPGPWAAGLLTAIGAYFFAVGLLRNRI
jgi:phosphatidylcholine synthase